MSFPTDWPTDDPWNVFADAVVENIKGLPLVLSRRIPVNRITEKGDLLMVDASDFGIGVLLPLPHAIGTIPLQGSSGAEGVMDLEIGVHATSTSKRSTPAMIASRIAWEVMGLQQVVIPISFLRPTLKDGVFVQATARLKTRLIFQSSASEWEPPSKDSPGGGLAIRWDGYVTSSLEMG